MENQEMQIAQDALSDEEKKLNRQINYFIMRYMWQVIRGRRRDNEGTIYNAFNTSRERYTRIINTGTVRYSKGELDMLQKETGLPKEIFSGDVRFQCTYVVKTLGGSEEKTITTEEWDTLFKWRKDRNSSAEEFEQQKSESCQTEICKRLQQVPRNKKDNLDFYRLCFYLKHKKAAPPQTPISKLREIEASIKELTFPLLDECEVMQLQKFQKLLKDKQTLISAMVTYKNASDQQNKK